MLFSFLQWSSSTVRHLLFKRLQGMTKGGPYENDSDISNTHTLNMEERKFKAGESKRRIKWGWKKKSETESEDWSIFEEFDSCVNQKNRNWGF